MRLITAVLTILVLAAPAFAQDKMVYPYGVVAKGETIYVADRKLPGIWKIEKGKAEVFFKASKKFRTPLNAVWCFAIDHEGKLLAGDSATREVYRFDESNKPVPLTKGGIGLPMSMAVAKDGTIYVADTEVHRIWKVPAKGGKPVEFAVINSPRGVALDKEERLWIVSLSSKNGQVQRAGKDGKLETVLKGRPFRMPHNIALMDDGTFFVTDNYSGGIWKVSKDGKPELAMKGAPLKMPVGLARMGKELVISDPKVPAIFVTKAGKPEQIAPPK